MNTIHIHRVRKANVLEALKAIEAPVKVDLTPRAPERVAGDWRPVGAAALATILKFPPKD